ncbi:MAG: DUF975 family protein [Treponema sp.]|nr:DUF975 family protein [Treponema sp.]
MFCVHCGNELTGTGKFCLSCGFKIKTANSLMDYSVIQENVELRACSRKQLQGVWGEMALTIFVYFLVVFPVQFIFWEYSPFHNARLETLVSIAVFVVSGPFSLGFAGYWLKRIRGNEISTSNIFDGFNAFFPSFVLVFFIYILVLLWSLLLIIPGIIKGLEYSMAFYIMHDNPGINPFEAIKKSKMMMKGYKGKLFLLYLSFTGWALLGLLTLGIGWLWLYPYVGLSEGNFYENLKQNQEKLVANNAVK